MKDSHRILGVIPARGGSKGVHRKNIALLEGKPLIEYTIQAAQQAKLLTDFVVSTEDHEIAQVSKMLGAPVPFLRPKELSDDKSLSYPVLRHALDYMEDLHGSAYDGVMLLQPTTPLRSSRDIDACITALFSSDADSIVSVTSVGAFHPLRMKLMKDGYLVNLLGPGSENLQPRQELPPVFIRNGAVYLSRRAVVVEEGSMVGSKCLPYLMPSETSVNIDQELDLVVATQLLREQEKNANQ